MSIYTEQKHYQNRLHTIHHQDGIQLVIENPSTLRMHSFLMREEDRVKVALEILQGVGMEPTARAVAIAHDRSDYELTKRAIDALAGLQSRRDRNARAEADRVKREKAIAVSRAQRASTKHDDIAAINQAIGGAVVIGNETWGDALYDLGLRVHPAGQAIAEYYANGAR